mmetsp:Transcript_18011/g.34143  ORF Transcript_18011/g.34143 Transcript_18011/m.34143 type:complete len:181 (-) Transcript_18011:233-775(-)|eukprot:CAMPEP_0170177634 /NCGR_PEP_ID=MMETSP0040_2-20121228/10643_1 /TAXON_ID=641309 /ORGANISM="Lotharella oceanica, Strain CCMP622" /LENGTH=180 /DNA_ID=CAMNT_0010420331 /DNA_START=48 /DNA_END=590 /DNA_ORIENTATION=+
MPIGQRPIDYDSFYLLPKAVNARPGMRLGPEGNEKQPDTPSKSNPLSPPNLASRLSAKAKKFVPKKSDRKTSPSEGRSREYSPAKSDASGRSKYSWSTVSTPEASPKLIADEMDSYSEKSFNLRPESKESRFMHQYMTEQFSHRMPSYDRPEAFEQQNNWTQQRTFQSYGYDHTLSTELQ